MIAYIFRISDTATIRAELTLAGEWFVSRDDGRSVFGRRLLDAIESLERQPAPLMVFFDPGFAVPESLAKAWMDRPRSHAAPTGLQEAQR